MFQIKDIINTRMNLRGNSVIVLSKTWKINKHVFST